MQVGSYSVKWVLNHNLQRKSEILTWHCEVVVLDTEVIIGCKFGCILVQPNKVCRVFQQLGLLLCESWYISIIFKHWGWIISEKYRIQDPAERFKWHCGEMLNKRGYCNKWSISKSKWKQCYHIMFLGPLTVPCLALGEAHNSCVVSVVNIIAFGCHPFFYSFDYK